MKVLFDAPVPFMLAHGGAQVQLQQTMRALVEAGADVEPLRWWDPAQSGEILHHLGRVPTHLIHLAHQKGLKVVQAELLTEQGSRSRAQLLGQRLMIQLLTATTPRKMRAAFNWESYRLADASIANTPWEAHLMLSVFGAPAQRVHVVPNGVEEVFLGSSPTLRGEWLVCTATITERKRVLELAEAAVLAEAPLRIIGKPYTDTDPYAQRFLGFVRENPGFIRYDGEIENRAQLARVYREARGFVLLSTMETRSLASEEAAACECPLLLTDLPWARSVYGEHARYCPARASARETADILRKFYATARELKAPPRPLAWSDVARQLRQLYETLLRTS